LIRNGRKQAQISNTGVASYLPWTTKKPFPVQESSENKYQC